MYAIGHFALGYLAGKASAKLLKVQLNMPLLLAASVIPDIDAFFVFLQHRGPTHSLITISIMLIPFFLLYRKTVVPYGLALVSHSLIGDFIGGAQLFWPLSTEWFGAPNICANSLINVLLELALFLVSIVVMFKMGDLGKIVKDKHKIVLLLPFGAVLAPLLAVAGGLEFAIPPLLFVPSLFYVVILGYSMLVGMFKK